MGTPTLGELVLPAPTTPGSACSEVLVPKQKMCPTGQRIWLLPRTWGSSNEGTRRQGEAWHLDHSIKPDPSEGRQDGWYADETQGKGSGPIWSTREPLDTPLLCSMLLGMPSAAAVT